MELKDFVSQSIFEICEGIKEAQEKCSGSGLVVAPPVTDDGKIAKTTRQSLAPCFVRFNLKIIVEKHQTRGKEGGGFSLNVAGAGMTVNRAKMDKENEVSSTLQDLSFDIPVIWPTTLTLENSGPAVMTVRTRNPFDDY